MEMNTSAAVIARDGRRLAEESLARAGTSAGARRIALRTQGRRHGPVARLGSAIKHPYPLVLGYYSVHTSRERLDQGEAEINRIGQRLRAAGRF